jgi:hypothetical protein
MAKQNTRLLSIERISLRELIIGLGFVEGLWMAAGIDPQAAIFGWISTLLEKLHASSNYFLILKVLPIVLLAGSLLLILRLGGWLGLVAVGLAFAAGLLIITTPTTSVFLIMGALVLGGFASKRR